MVLSEDEAKADAEKEAKMKRVAEGKERLKHKSGFEIDDEDFDDDGYGQSKNRPNKKAKIQNASIEQLGPLPCPFLPSKPIVELILFFPSGQDEETQSFVGSYREGLVVDVKQGEHDFLMIVAASDVEDEDSDEEDDDEERDTLESQMEEGPRLSRKEAERMAIEKTRQVRSVSAPLSGTPETDSLLDC